MLVCDAQSPVVIVVRTVSPFMTTDVVNTSSAKIPKSSPKAPGFKLKNPVLGGKKDVDPAGQVTLLNSGHGRHSLTSQR
jgi:hypothetical protein